MAETFILNPRTGTDPELGFNRNWSYASKQTPADNMVYTQPRRSYAIARETGVKGYSFDMNFQECSWQKVQWLKRIYEDFKTGYFTIIDHDGGGRHYVGRFTTPIASGHDRNLIYTLTGIKFEEVQGARMLQYPCDWLNDARIINVIDDNLNPNVASGYTAGPAFAIQQTPAAVAAGISTNDPSSYELFCNSPAGVTDAWAQVQYIGWGFFMNFRLGTNYGIVSIYVDGSEIGELDLYTGAWNQIVGTYPYIGIVTVSGASGVGSVQLTVSNMPLNSHRVKVQAGSGWSGDPGSGKYETSTGYSILFPQIRVMR